ncbi:MAG TPA: methyltransferase domain-containing protein [Anaerolineales bacterium]|nr:methyltransferase domain-containing protein [Anaerolineales bacterium]
MENTERYIPALRFHWLTPLYDPLVHRFMREDLLRSQLVLEADILPGMRVLDLGCGTGTLAILIKQGHWMSQVYGLDADPQVLEIAQGKAKQACTGITLDQGLAYQLPYPDEWFDRIVTSLVLHHLTTIQKQQAINEVYRVLKPGGKFIALDFGVPHGTYSRLIGQIMRRTERVEDNIRGLLPGMIASAGFDPVAEIGWFATLFGSLSIYRADKQRK